jgi:hypothetical protein
MLAPPLGSTGISLSRLESFDAQEIDLPLEGIKGVSGTIRVRLLWQPQLLAKKKQQTSILSSGTKVLTGTAGATFGAGKAVVGGGLHAGTKVVGGGLHAGTKVVGGGIHAGGKVIGGGGKVIGGGGKAIGSVFGFRRGSKASKNDNGNNNADPSTVQGDVIPNTSSGQAAVSGTDGGLHSNRNSVDSTLAAGKYIY